MAHTVFHIEDETKEVQTRIYSFIGEAAQHGIQLTHMNFTVNDIGTLRIDGVPPGEWIDAMTEREY